jgi:hypothetical protein
VLRRQAANAMACLAVEVTAAQAITWERSRRRATTACSPGAAVNLIQESEKYRDVSLVLPLRVVEQRGPFAVLAHSGDCLSVDQKQGWRAGTLARHGP